MSPLKMKTLALAVAASAAGISVPTIAQQATAPVEEVYVVATPIRDSQAAAITKKREALNAVEIVASDTIGRFPDQNLADSLGRLPGLAIERDQGQARYINMRGAPFRYTTIAFDGIDVPGAENGRIPRFDSFPSVITSQIEANKAILPSMPGESVAGFINIHTFSPFSKEGLGLSADMGLGEQALGGGDISKLGLRSSWSNKHFGVLVYGSDNNREQVTDNREYDLETTDNGTLVVNELDFRSYKVERADQAFGGSLEYRGDDIIRRVYLSSLYSEFVDNEERNQFVFDLAGTEGVTGSNIPVSVSRMLEYGQYKNSTQVTTLGTELALGAWAANASYSDIATEFMMDLPIPRSMMASTTASYNLSNIEDPILTLAENPSSLDYPVTIGLHYIQALDVDADKLKFSAKRDVQWFGQEATFETGMQWDTREASGYIATPQVGSFPITNIEAYNTSTPWDSNTTNSIGATYYDNIGLRDAWAATGALTIGEVSEANLVAIDEDILAAYAMTTTRFSWGNLVLGARIEQTDYQSQGTLNGEALNVSDSFTDFLPSAHVNVDLTSQLQWRISATTGVNRPTYNEWRAAASVDVANQEVSGGNPYLKAEEAMGFETALEWYFAPASLFSAGVFYRTIDDVIYADSTIVEGENYLAQAAGERWEYEGTVNGDNGKMSGLELSFTGHAVDLTTALAGFGFSANLTALESEFEGIDGTRYDLPGTSDLIYNASIFFEKFGLSTRLNYQYRDEWISPIESPDEVWGEQERFDFSASYDLPLSLAGATPSIYFNANNLTDETDLRYAGNGTVNQSESYGRHYLVGVRINY